MALEGDPTSGTFYINGLVATYPGGGESKSQGDDHLRLIKKAVKNTFQNIDAPVTATEDELNLLDGVTATTTELNYVDGVTSSIQTQLNAKQATITGAATTIDTEDLTASRALASSSAGKVEVSSVTATELGYVSGVTSAIQTQIAALKTFDIQFILPTGADGTYVLLQKASFAFTIDRIIHDTQSGSISANIRNDGASVLSESVTSSEDDNDVASSVSVGATVDVVLSSNSSAVGVSIQLKCVRA